MSLGMLEELEKEGLHFVEWGTNELEKILNDVGIDVATISIEKISFEKRSYTICIN
jgi:tRNA threonylcarbamoyladenosine biosynthesis protein TsaE